MPQSPPGIDVMKLEGERHIAQNYFHSREQNRCNSSTSSTLLSGKVSKGSSWTTRGIHAGRLQEQLSFLSESSNTMELTSCEKLLLERMFVEWRMQLDLGFNLVLYGLGSKSRLIESFVEDDCMADVHVLHWSNYDSSTGTISELWSAIERVCLVNSDQSSLMDGQHLAGRSVLVIIEGADHFIMHSDQIWQRLAGIHAQFQKGKSLHDVSVQFMFTVEHNNALMLPAAFGKLSLLWHDATTMRAYRPIELAHILLNAVTDDDEEEEDEEEFDEDEDVQMDQNQTGNVNNEGRRTIKSSSRRLQGAQAVLASLPPGGRSVFAVLARHVQSLLSDHTSVRSIRLSYMEWYQKCQDEFCVSTEAGFRTQLTELLDHHVVRQCESSSASFIVDGEEDSEDVMAAVENVPVNVSSFYLLFSASELSVLLSLCE